MQTVLHCIRYALHCVPLRCDATRNFPVQKRVNTPHARGSWFAPPGRVFFFFLLLEQTQELEALVHDGALLYERAHKGFHRMTRRQHFDVTSGMAWTIFVHSPLGVIHVKIDSLASNI